MKSESARTGIFVAAALVLALAAAWVEPGAATPEIFSDQGDPLFPQFTNVQDVTAIEVIDYNADEALATPLKAELRDGKWLLPSHNDYPAQAGDRLASTAGALLDLHKDLVVSDRLEDQATYGVIDPMDADSASLTGRGKHVTLRDAQENVLADLVIGEADSEHAGYRYVRIPGQKRIYSVKTDADPSAQFADWVAPNLLDITEDDIGRVVRNSYSIDETLGRLSSTDITQLTKNGEDWRSSGARSLDSETIEGVISTLASLRVVGAQPKPETFARQLASGEGLEMSLDAVVALRQRGFFIANNGSLLSNEGEMTVETNDGLSYTLRFGEIDTTRGSASDEEEGNAEQDRFLFVTVSANEDSARDRARELSERFAGWFYVISGEDFRTLSLRG